MFLQWWTKIPTVFFLEGSHVILWQQNGHACVCQGCPGRILGMHMQSRRSEHAAAQKLHHVSVNHVVSNRLKLLRVALERIPGVHTLRKYLNPRMVVHVFQAGTQPLEVLIDHTRAKIHVGRVHIELGRLSKNEEDIVTGKQIGRAHV